MDERERLPEYGEAKKCILLDCPGPGNFEQGYGNARGGIGPYEWCSHCCRIVSKSLDLEELE